ncbi:MAG: proton-conducting transporter membrane subunit [Pseudomonadota bacterium]
MMYISTIIGALGLFLSTGTVLAAQTASEAAGGAAADQAAAETVPGATATVDPLLTVATPLAAWLAALPIALPLLGAGLTLVLRNLPRWQAPMALIVLGLTALTAVGLSAVVEATGPIMMAMGNWTPPFGIVIAVDSLGALLVLVTSLVGLIGIGYARLDVGDEGVKYGFYSFYLLLICGVNGAFSTGDIFNLYVWFEVFLISSFGLMILGGTNIQLDGAVKYGVLNLIATTVFLIAVGATYGATGTLNMADLQRVLADNDAAPLLTIAALFVLAFAMKAAAFPLHFWLPASYHTPKVIVSAIFAGLLTKVGVYSLMRIVVMLFGADGAVYMPLIVILGVLTAVLGAMGALAQVDLKRLAAFLVVSGIGVMMIGIGLGTQQGLTGAIVYTVHSILVMTGLFLILGMCDRLSQGGSLLQAGGLYSARGFAAALFLVFGFSTAGLPPFSGFWPKFILVEASLAVEGSIAILGVLGIIISGFITTIVIGRAWALVFLTPQPAGAPAVSAEPVNPAVIILAGFVVGLGLFPAFVVDPAINGAAGLLNPSAYVTEVLGGR